MSNRPRGALDAPEEAVAIIGMAGRFPGASSVEALWRLLDEGKETIPRFSTEQLSSAGVPSSALEDPGFVAAGSHLEDAELFDAELFGYAPREAELMDPQQRIFLECAWQALESAGYDPRGGTPRTGVFGGVGGNTYQLALLSSTSGERPELFRSVGMLQLGLGTGADFVATRVSYKLDLKGPSLTVQTACSTSLVAVHLACQSLLVGECDMALAGGASVIMPQGMGYVYEEGSILSPDGRCRAYDAAANGTVLGNAVGVVVLKRLEEALRDRDTIAAVILGSAVNNDGAAKVGYTAPSVEGQAEVIAEAWSLAGVRPDDLAFIEGHGTGTVLGDAIELKALRQVLEGRRRPCPIGSLKSNVGHLNAAAGVAGLIKSVLALEHRRWPMSLHIEHPNPAFDEESVVYVPRQPVDLDGAEPLVGAVSSFGFGGTNAHVVLQEAPAAEVLGTGRCWQLLCLSARSDRALARAGQTLAADLAHREAVRPEGPKLEGPKREGTDLEDVAFTLQLGRHAFDHRGFVVTRPEDAASALRALTRAQGASEGLPLVDRDVVFVFAGQGAQHPGMGGQLYSQEPLFREEVDRCLDLLEAPLRDGVRRIAFIGEPAEPQANGELDATAVAQPALFVLEYALARLLMRCGITPRAMLGHSLGEYVAACLAGVFSLEEALALVVERGRLMQACPPGAMLAVGASPEELSLGAELSLAAVNAPDLCVVSGPGVSIAGLAEELERRGVWATSLRTSHAFHSSMMDPCIAPFSERVAAAGPRPPKLRVVSSATGGWMTAGEAASPDYWAQHLRQTVRFRDGLQTLLAMNPGAVVEIGPDESLARILRHQLPQGSAVVVDSVLAAPLSAASLGAAPDSPGRAADLPEPARLLGLVGRLWAQGMTIDWEGLYPQRRRRVPLPGSAFERERYDLTRRNPRPSQSLRPKPAALDERQLDSWFYLPTWRQLPQPPSAQPRPGNGCSMVLADAHGVGSEVARRLNEAGHEVVEVCHQKAGGPGQLLELFRELAAERRRVTRLVHLWTLFEGGDGVPSPTSIDGMLERGFYSLLEIARAHAEIWPGAPLDLCVVSDGVFALGEEAGQVANSVLLGPCRVLPKEQPELQIKLVDLSRPLVELGGSQAAELVCRELAATDEVDVVVHRAAQRWTPGFEPTPIAEAAGVQDPLQLAGKTVLVTGGLGGVGTALATHLARRGCKLVLTGRRSPPGEETPLPTAMQERLAMLRQITPDVLYVAADVSDAEAMEEALTQGRELFGAVHGVIHCAGVAGGGLAQLRSRDAVETVLAPKIRGTLVLDRLLAREPTLEFFVLCSSAQSVLGGVGQVDYVTANAFLDAYARWRTQSGRATSAIGWGTWSVGMSRDASPVQGLEHVQQEQLANGIRPGEGGEILERVLRHRLPHVVVSPVPLGPVPLGPVPLGPVPLDPVPLDPVPLDPVPDVASNRRKAAAEGTRSRAPGVGGAPREETQRRVAAIWEEVLGVRDIGLDDDFVGLGGHSLLAAQVASRLREVLGVEVSLSRVFERPTIAGMASLVDAPAGAESVEGAATAAATSPSSGTTAPLSFSQERLWFLEQLQPHTDTFNEPHALRIPGPLDTAALDRALAAIRERHEALRTVFQDGSVLQDGLQGATGGVRQVVVAARSVPLEITDLGALPAKRRVSEARRRIDEAAQVPFDLQRGPLFRTHLFRLGDDDHLLFLNAHHIVFDEWSLGVLLRELQCLYRGFLEGAPPQLPELALQYRDHAAWQRQQITSEQARADLAYWRERLADLPHVDLPTDAPRPAVQTYHGGVVRRALPGELAAGIEALGRARGATLFMTLLTGFQLLLARYCGQKDIAVGSPVANRNRADLEGLIGCFVNMIVLRTEVDAAENFTEMLERVRTGCLAAYEHQDYPFERLVHELDPPRDPGRHPLFQVAFDLQVASDPQEGALRFEPFEFRSEKPKFDLVFRLRQSESGLTGSLVYNRDLFDVETVRCLFDSYETLLAAAVADPDRPVAQLPLVGAVDDVERPFPSARSGSAAARQAGPLVQHRIEQLAARAPEALAISGGGEQLSYRRLNRQANRLARRLQELGVGPDGVVGVLLEPSTALPVALLAVLKAGGAYLPLDPYYPDARLRLMLEDARPAVLITTAELAGRIGDDGGGQVPVETVLLEAVLASPAADEEGDPVVEIDRDHLAYVIYTSGSTGRPNGVGVSHGALLNLVDWHRRAYGLNGEDRATQLASVAFDASVWEIWPYLASGASVHLPDPAVRHSPVELWSWLAAAEITIAFVPTPLLESALGKPLPSTTSLRALLTGGDLLHRAPEQALPFELFNHYGPTENAVVSTAAKVSVAAGTGVPPIGRPIDNVRAHVLDAHLQPLPQGAPGELYLGGAGLARGYLHRPGLTAERFLPDPFSGEPGARLYRTGDLVRQLPDGNLLFRGRRDQQVKIRGFRIEAGEVEAALVEHPGIDEAVVAVRTRGEVSSLEAYCTEAPDAPVTEEELRRCLGERLPVSMIPSRLYRIERMPLTGNGKIDRARVATLQGSRFHREATQAPRGELETRIAAIWLEVLDVPAIGRDESFFDAGGHSLLAAEVFSRLQESRIGPVRLLDLFAHPTIRTLAEHLGSDPADRAASAPNRALEVADGKARLERLRRLRL